MWEGDEGGYGGWGVYVERGGAGGWVSANQIGYEIFSILVQRSYDERRKLDMAVYEYRYEYRTELLPYIQKDVLLPNQVNPVFNNFINDMGRNGWKLVEIQPVRDSAWKAGVFVRKRVGPSRG
jgi:hypothetical protein